MRTFKPVLIPLAFALVFGCHRERPNSAVDVVSGATTPHDQIILPPTNAHYRVLGHIEGLNGYVVQYDERLYRGGRVYLDDLAAEALDNLGVKTIISVTPDAAERAFCETYGYHLVEIEFDDSGPKPEDYALLLETLDAATDPVYVHCEGGSHRAGTLGAAYRLNQCGWPLDRALIEYGRLGGDLKSDHVMTETLRPIKTASK